MGRKIDESDDTEYYITPVHVMDNEETVALDRERSTVIERVNKGLSSHPVWSGAIVAAVCFMAASALNAYDQQTLQPAVDNMQDYRIDNIETDIDAIKTTQTIQGKTLVRIEAMLKVLVQ